MLVSSIILSFVLGVVVTLLLQFLFIQYRFKQLPTLKPPYRPQSQKFQLPSVLKKALKKRLQKPSTSRDSHTQDGDHETKLPPEPKKGHLKQDNTLCLNVLMQFLFAELKDTTRVRQWAARKLNAEFEEMLKTTTGKFINQIQVRDMNFGTTFPVVNDVRIENVETTDDVIQTLDIGLDMDYSGGFQLALDVDIILKTWAYISITVTRLCGRARLQMTRLPYTHWSFTFYEEPLMEFEVDSRFNGRPLPQISSLIINQIKRSMRKKHILPNYKMRYKPMFVRQEQNISVPDISFKDHKLGQGQLKVTLEGCSRLQDLPPDSTVYCTLSVDKHDMEEVWKQSYYTVDVEIHIQSHRNVGLDLKDQVSRQKSEKRRVVVDRVVPDSPAGQANIQRGDIIESIGHVRVMSVKHAVKQLKQCGDRFVVQLTRKQNRFGQEDVQFPDGSGTQLDDIDLITEKEDDLGFINVEFNNDPKPMKEDGPSIPPQREPQSREPQKSTEGQSPRKLSYLFDAGRRKILGNRSASDTHAPDHDELRRKSMETESGHSSDPLVGTGSCPSQGFVPNGSHSAQSSPHKFVSDMKHLRAHSDTSLNKQVLDGDTHSLPGDTASCYSYQDDRKMGQINTLEVPFSKNPVWNEEFVFECTDDDQYVNVCVWCKIAQVDRGSKQASGKTEAKHTPPTDTLSQYEVTTKIGFVSLPLTDIAAGCLLTKQGDAKYNLYLQPPEEMLVASRTKPAEACHAGFDRTICHGDISLTFSHVPFRKVEAVERRRIIEEILNPPPQSIYFQSQETDKQEGVHQFMAAQFPSRTICQFCGKKIWLKGALQCVICRMICHKKCVDKCQHGTYCTRDGVRMKDKPSEPWVIPDGDKGDGASLGRTSILRKLRHKEPATLPLNIPAKQSQSQTSASPARPGRSPGRPPSPFFGADTGLYRSHSNTAVSNLDKDEDSDDDAHYKSRLPGYSLDDSAVIEAKEKGKELFSHLPLPERKQTLDEMVSKLQLAIDKETEHKHDIMKGLSEPSDAAQGRWLTQQLDKCEEKMEALMMMMVHYCAGLQHCLDSEEAQRILEMASATTTDISRDDGVLEATGDAVTSGNVTDSSGSLVDSTEDTGIQFVVTDTDQAL